MNYELPAKFTLLPRKKNTDKSHYGHVLVIAGSDSMAGAAVMTSLAAMKSGSGLVTLMCPEGTKKVLSKTIFEIIKIGLPETKQGAISIKAYPRIAEFLKKRKINVCAVGPGLSPSKDTTAVVRKLITNISVPVVLDADGLNSLRGKSNVLMRKKSPIVLTPHQREFERLFAKKLPEDKQERIRLAKKLSNIYDVVLVIKGHQTLVVEANRVYVNKTGNPGMAKAGTGDVLTGMIASFIGQGLEPFLASTWAVYFHGKAGDLVAKEKGQLGLMATDIIDFLPRVFK